MTFEIHRLHADDHLQALYREADARRLRALLPRGARPGAATPPPGPLAPLRRIAMRLAAVVSGTRRSRGYA